MAAPKKAGLDYFPLDVGIFHDSKMIPLKAQFSAEGIAVYIDILCRIYGDKGYYIEVNEDFYFLVSDETKVRINTIRQIINFLLGRSLFDNKLFQSDKVLTSRSIQKRYQEAVTVRGKKTPVTVDSKYWLLKKEETRSFIQYTLFSEGSGKNGVIPENNPHYSREKPPKVKESKVKESKDITPLPPLQGEQPAQQENELNSSHKKEDIKAELNKIWNDSKLGFSPILQKEIQDWIQYKKEIKKEYKTVIGFTRFLTQVRKNVQEFGEKAVIQIMDSSMANGYQGITWDKLQKISREGTQNGRNQGTAGKISGGNFKKGEADPLAGFKRRTVL